MAIDFLGALGAGSDIDTKALVQSLVDAERAPKQSSIEKKVEKSENLVSAYGVVLSDLSILSDAFARLNDNTDFSASSVTVNGANTADGGPSFTLSPGEDFEPGSIEVEVDALAERERWTSIGYENPDVVLNGGDNFTIDVTIDSVISQIIVTEPTPQGVVDALSAADLGIEATLLDTGIEPTPWKISVAGQLGADNAFSLSHTGDSGQTLSISQSSTAQNARLIFNGVPIERSTNEVDDLIQGATLTLLGETAGSATIVSRRDTSIVEADIRSLVDVYNQIDASLDAMSDAESSDPLGGVFSGNSSFRLLRDQLKEVLISESSSGSGQINFLNDLGVRLDRYGKLEIDDTRLSNALENNFDDVVTFFSANTDNQSNLGEAARGLAGDAVYLINNLMASDGVIKTQTSGLETRIQSYEVELSELDDRMSRIYDRYLAQFTAMEIAIDEMNALRDSLKSQLENLPFTSNNN